VHAEDIKGQSCIKPPLSEQKQIAAFLDHETRRMDALIARQLRLIELLKEKRQAVISHAVTKGLNPNAPMKDSGIEWLGEVPEHWVIKPLKRLLSKKLQYGANESGDADEPSHPRYIRITDFGSDGFLKSDTFRSLPPDLAHPYLLKDRDLLFARSGATVGKTFLFKNYSGIACFAGYLILARPSGKLNSEFLYYFTRSTEYETWKNSIFIQATIQNIGADKYEMLSVPTPPISEQVTIVNHLDNRTQQIDRLIERAESSIAFTRERRTALISAAVTGKIDVREWRAKEGGFSYPEIEPGMRLAAEPEAEWDDE